MIFQRKAEERQSVHIGLGMSILDGELRMPPDACGVVVFAHGSGSSRHSPRNQQVAARLRQAGLATLLIDLLTSDEAELDRHSGELRFDVQFLGERVAMLVDWLQDNPSTRALRVGIYGSSTGGGAALVAATLRPAAVGAVVSRGGRPDLAGPALPQVQAPTLLIVGGADQQVLALNEQAMEQMQARRRLEVIAGAGHLFEEPGTLEQVAEHAAAWLSAHLPILRERAAGA